MIDQKRVDLLRQSDYKTDPLVMEMLDTIELLLALRYEHLVTLTAYAERINEIQNLLKIERGLTKQ